MNVVDSSGWLEYFADTGHSNFFAPAIENTRNLVVPVISIYEVYKRIYAQRGRDMALQASASMQLAKVVYMDENLAMEAAEFSADNKVPMADSIIYVTARSYNAVLWTQDEDLAPFDKVRYQSKKP